MFTADLSARQIDDSQFHVLTKSNFLQRITDYAHHAGSGSKIVITTMSFTANDPMVDSCLTALSRAARQGAEVLLLVDAYAFMISDDALPFGLGPLFYGKPLTKKAVHKPQFRTSFQALVDLRDAGGRYAIVNVPSRKFSNPLAGRSHIKLALLDDTVYVGGCNLNSSTDIDLMIGWDDAYVSDQLYSLTRQLAQQPSIRRVLGHDKSFAIDKLSDLVFDCGNRGKSLIYEKALSMIDKAKEFVYLTCQFFPGGQTAAHLRAAHRRGVDVTIIYNDPRKNGHFKLAQYPAQAIERLRNPPGFFTHSLSRQWPYLHTKLLATESGFMLGSHNYVSAGVSLGTAELTLVRHDPKLSKRLIQVSQSQLNKH